MLVVANKADLLTEEQLLCPAYILKAPFIISAKAKTDTLTNLRT